MSALRTRSALIKDRRRAAEPSAIDTPSSGLPVFAIEEWARGVVLFQDDLSSGATKCHQVPHALARPDSSHRRVSGDRQTRDQAEHRGHYDAPRWIATPTGTARRRSSPLSEPEIVDDARPRRLRATLRS